MKKLISVGLLLSFIAVILTGCGKGIDVEELIEKKELTYLDRYIVHDDKYIVFESVEDKKYYEIEVNSWAYDNLQFESDIPQEYNFLAGRPYSMRVTQFLLDNGYSTDKSIEVEGRWYSLNESIKYTQHN